MTQCTRAGTGSSDLAILTITRLAEATTTNLPTDIKVNILQYSKCIHLIVSSHTINCMSESEEGQLQTSEEQSSRNNQQ